MKSDFKELEDEMKEMVEENQGLKNELEEIKKVNDVSLKKVRVYEKRVLDFDVRVSGLEKLGKELMDSPDFSDNKKNHVLVCKTRTFILWDKPHSFFAPEGKPSRRGLKPRPLACGNNLPKVTLGGHLS
nr:hypothetical protein [Tanacetum cinerariifolium]